MIYSTPITPLHSLLLESTSLIPVTSFWMQSVLSRARVTHRSNRMTTQCLIFNSPWYTGLALFRLHTRLCKTGPLYFRSHLPNMSVMQISSQMSSTLMLLCVIMRLICLADASLIALFPAGGTLLYPLSTLLFIFMASAH